MSDCPICEQINDSKNFKGRRSNISFKVALIEESYRNGVYRGKLTWKPYKFRFCPICGKKYSKSSLYVRADKCGEVGESE